MNRFKDTPRRRFEPVGGWTLRVPCVTLGAAAGLLIGCQPAPEGSRPFGSPQSPSRTREDVPRIVKCLLTYSPSPWVNLDRDDEPEGITFRVLLIPADSPRGVLADGTFHVELYRRLKDVAEGEEDRELVADWTTRTQDCTHTKAPKEIGDFYVLTLHWHPHDILEQDVEFIVTYEDPLGRRSIANPIRVRVPRVMN